MRFSVAVNSALLLPWVVSFGVAAADSTIRMRTTSGVVETVHIRAVPGSDDRTGVQLCVALAARTICHRAAANRTPFPFAPEWSPVPEPGHPDTTGFLLFTAQAEPFFSRQDKLLSMLVLDLAKRTLKDTLPSLVLSEQSEHSIWEDGRFSALPLLTTADFHWDMEHETHFGPHQYRVNTYVSHGTEKYVLTDSYLTRRSYAGLDDVDQLAVIEGEMSTIQQHLTEKNGHR